MKIKAKMPYRLVRAFTGQEFVNYEWRPVPEGSEDEARRLEAAGYAELLVEPEPIELDIPTVQVVEVNATKSAIELAAEYGLDLAGIYGTGAGGRIVKGDVERIVFEEEE